MPEDISLDISAVRIRTRVYCGAYIARGGGKTASNTSSHLAAADKVAEKIFGSGEYGLVRRGPDVFVATGRKPK